MVKKFKIETRQKMQGILFIAPWVIGFLMFWAYPFIYSFVMSLSKILFRSEGLEWEMIGLDNYVRIVTTDSQFLDRLIIFIQESVIMIPIIVVFALIIALLLNQKFSGRMLFRTIFFIPVILTSGNLIMELTAQGGSTTLDFLQSEAINVFLNNNLGFRSAQAISGIFDKFVIILWFSGVQILLLIAGLQSISPSVYEAAKIDGANSWETLWKITLPSLAPFIGIISVYTVVEQATLPMNPIISTIEYHMTRENTGLGYSAAVAWIYFLAVMLMIGFIFLIFRKSMRKS